MQEGRVVFLCSRYDGACAALLLGAAVALSAQEITHSAPMIERYGKPYVMVTVNGKGPYRFVIDTGTGADAFVSPELADELHLPAFAEAVVRDITTAGGMFIHTRFLVGAANPGG